MTRWYVRLLGPGIDVSGYVEAEANYQVERLFADDVTDSAALIVSNIDPEGEATE